MSPAVAVPPAPRRHGSDVLSSALQVDVAFHATGVSTGGGSDGGQDGDSQTERGQVAGNPGHAHSSGGLQTAHLQVSAGLESL